MNHIFWTIVLAFFFIGGCTKSQLCDAGKTASGLLAAQVAVQLDCKNTDAIRADIDKLLVEKKVCEVQEAQKTSAVRTLISVGDVICQPVIEGLTASLLSQVPAAWGCSGGKVTEEIKLKLAEACAKAF